MSGEQMAARVSGERAPDSAPIRLLIAEDEEHLGAILEHFLRGRGYDVTMCRDGRTALQALHSAPFEVALLDIVMPEMDGLEVLRHLQSESEPPEVIIITGNGTIDTAINAIKLGAYDYISKPYRMAEIDVMVRRAWEKRELNLANTMLRNQSAQLPRSCESTCVAMQETLRTLAAVASQHEPIAIVGEAGSGKSYLARHVHSLSGRPRDAFVEVSAAQGRLATVGDLFGSEGAVGSGAGAAATGALMLGARGTVAIDIEQLDQDARAALDRAVREGWFIRVGGTRRIGLTARIVACARDSEVAATFPAATRVNTTPLRGRTTDINQIAQQLLLTLDGGRCTLASDAIDALSGYAWPGNVAELLTVLTRASLLNSSGNIAGSDVRPLLVTGMSATVGHGEALGDLERVHIETTLVRCNWHQGRAAAALGISTKTLYRKMREYGFQRPRNRKLARTRPDS